MLRLFISDEGGQDLIEYALLAALVSVSVIAALTALGISLNAYWTSIEAGLFP